MASPIFISKPPLGFSILAVLRGIQLALLGAYRSLQNPKLFLSSYYKQAWTAVKYSILLQCVLILPLLCIKVVFKFLSVLFGHSHDLDSIAHNLGYFQKNILNLAVFAITGIRFLKPDLDELFLTSLKFIDNVYVAKHPERSEHQYHDNLLEVSDKLNDLHYSKSTNWFTSVKDKYRNSGEFSSFLQRYFKNSLFNISIYFLCKVPKIGPIILGIISFQNFNEKVGTVAASIIFLVLQTLPKHYSVLFLTIYWGSRNMIHDLLLPYFIRIQLSKSEKEQWMKSREGLLFGFGFCYYFLIYQLPWVGILIYGFAESSIAYLVTKVTDPPPSQKNQLINWNMSQLVWDKHKESLVLGGDFVDLDEGFVPIPGSFILDVRDKQM